MKAKSNGGAPILASLTSAMVGALVVGVVTHFTQSARIADLTLEVALLDKSITRVENDLRELPEVIGTGYWFSADAVTWRNEVDHHRHNGEIHQSAAEKAKLIREVVGAVLDEREKRTK